MKRIFFAALLFACASANAQFDFGRALDIGKKVIEAQEGMKDLTQDEEIALGEQLTAGFLGASPLHPDANLQRYVNRVGKWLRVAQRPTRPAVDLRGDRYRDHQRVRDARRRRDRLERVVEAPVERVGARGSALARDRARGEEAPAAGDPGGGQGRPRGFHRQGSRRRCHRAPRRGDDAGQAAKTWASGIAADLLKDGFFLRPLDRSMEYEADQMGVVIATRSGYDPYGLVGALEMLAQYKGGGDAASIFSTHPPATDRLGELEKFLPTVERYSGQPQLEGRFKQVVGAAK